MTSQSQGNPSNSNHAPRARTSQNENRPDDAEFHAMMERQRKEGLEMMRTGRGLKIEHPLPNPHCGPGRPVPDYINYYNVFDNYPAYLLCTYKVNEQHYDPSNEPAWFKSAILQMRSSGPQSFPPTLQWVAIIIVNSAEHKGVSTYEKCHKVGAIFGLKGVFDSSRDPLQLVAQAQMDRHPFVYDPKHSHTWKSDRWMIVERHAASDAKTTSN